MSRKKTIYYEREFLNKPGFYSQANIIASITRRYNDQNHIKCLEFDLDIADCYDQISLIIDNKTAEDRENSLHKVDKMIEILTGFRKALKKEFAYKEKRELRKKNKKR